MNAKFDWELLEYLADHGPIAFGLLVDDLEPDRDRINHRLERLRERGLAEFEYSSRPTHWRLTDDGRACLAAEDTPN